MFSVRCSIKLLKQSPNVWGPLPLFSFPRGLNVSHITTVSSTNHPTSVFDINSVEISFPPMQLVTNAEISAPEDAICDFSRSPQRPRWTRPEFSNLVIMLLLQIVAQAASLDTPPRPLLQNTRGFGPVSSLIPPSRCSL